MFHSSPVASTGWAALWWLGGDDVDGVLANLKNLGRPSCLAWLSIYLVRAGPAAESPSQSLHAPHHTADGRYGMMTGRHKRPRRLGC